MDPQPLPASMANDPPPPAEPLDVPDLMNDPAFDPNTQNPDKAQDEPDSCRICRGEGSPEEPLFYPCKCSGSIKFVHQECLMEWLSHSQKKYCELCKTSFRFTKLYSPHMPKKLPTRVFIQKAIMHVVSHVFVWLRGLLVGSVWLLGLPWLMRYSWRIMFWFGDAGWARDNGMDLVADLQGLPSDDAASIPLDTVSNHTMPSIPSFLNMTSQTLNVTRSEPLLFKLVKALGRSMYEPLRRSEILTEASSNLTVEPLLLQMAQQKQSSVLSEVDFLKHLTPSPTFNRLIIDILEGQIITVSVVVACILVFLIREWVLQQQPVADIAVGDADNALAQAGGGAQEQAQEDIDEREELSGSDDEFEIPDPADEAGASASRADAEEAAPIKFTAEDAPSSTVQEIKAVIDKTDNLLSDCSPEVRQVLLDQYPFLNNLESLRERAEHLDRETTLLPSRSPEPTEENAGQEAIDTPLRELLASVAKDVETSLRTQDSHAESSGTQQSISEDDKDQSKLNSVPRVSRFAGHLSSEASVDGSDETVKERPQMPIRERSFLATDIARSMEEQSAEEESPVHVPLEGFNTLSEDDQGSQGSSGSWQQVSAPEQNTVPHTSGDDSHVEDSPEAGENKGKDQAVSSSNVPPTLHRVNIFDESKALDSNITDHRVGPSGGRDDVSWISTAGSDPSHTREETDDPSRTEDPNDQQVAPSFDDDAEGSSGAQGAESSSGITVLNPQHEEVENRTVVERVMNWFWGDIPAPERRHIEGLLVEIEDGDDEHLVNDLANEAPFVPFAQVQPLAVQPQNAAGAEPAINPDDAVLAPPVNLDPNDPDAIDDAEDLEGILELIGMQGPVLGLFQNALFSSVLILISVITCVWLPYMYGKLVLLSLSVPELLIRVPLQMGTIIADLLIDSCLTVGGYLTFWVANFWRFAMSLFYIDVKARWLYQVTALPAHRIGYAALERLVGDVAATKELEAKDFLYLSMICHAGLRSLEESFFTGVRLLSDQVASISNGIYAITFSGLSELVSGLPSALVETEVAQFQSIKQALITLWNTGILSVSIGEPIVTPSDPLLAYWNAKDRALAVIAGYGAVAFCSACYLKIAPITSSPKYRHNEQYIIEVCQQAGGVLKVILIISIEMIAFPLFCGFLLDFALLPLFESATFSSRVSFTIFSPWTAGFVHWFVGTCYMFHFALFVSMCRKIMRTGVLYFIRDPDDPTFHPVRDVLERNVITQLRKIAFSAIVYGALIVICLGGVVWTMWFASTNVLPIHWTSSESALEFPLDILFYNFLTPVVVRFARPSDGLHTMYKWWFRKCARILRLSDFLFKDQHRDEQGHHVHRTWRSWLTRQTGDVEEAVDTEPEDKQVEVYFKRDGRHVKAPASDQVRIPKGSPVFVDVDEEVDDTSDGEAPQMNGTNPTMTAIVYIPPWFRVRIALFVVAVWFFAASTGIMVTIVPLLVGRKILSTAIPNANNVNDIYAFSLGIYVLGGILWTVLHYRPILTFLRNTFWPSSETRAQAASKILSSTKQVLSIVYVYSALGLGLPILFAVLLELYILMPIHVFFGPEDSHVIHVIQDWTLGILYVRIGTRILTWDRQSRTARAVQAVVRKGLLKPAAGLATRAFILPSLFAFGVLLGVPYAVSMALNGTVFRFADEEKQIQIIRLSYPIAMAVVLSIWIFIITTKATERWRSRIRDEVYLIGERLHNFGEKRPGPTSRKSDGEKTVVFRNGQLVVE
ncbi:ERAD-associated E3 ubiquitin-protein ligase doa10 [Venturia nashicola]|uniref:RING-type E3 ubiquitin transferase n=1 Tax=Venturia nashicola TaxID=86259 RepID=A0A4Z1P3R7_9PEZI|nr:ERAD-associated E3 ubiquitin-protein ligase doa10 [Venturia nashicola]TLD36146.1 ERAD-associated E3 ubiquitin-protein ligase doa10 [Venturia nashicola]